MKRSAIANTTPVTLQAPSVYKTLTRHRKQVIKKGPAAIKQPCPSDETVSRLNGIGREYPFCVYYRSKKNDPL